MLWLTPHREGRHEPDSFFGHWIPGCTLDACHRECRHLQRRLSYAFPRAVLVSKDWRPEVVQRTPCCEECRAFGPCLDCVTSETDRATADALEAFARLDTGGEAACVVCSRVGHCPHRCAMHTHCDECDGPPPAICRNGHLIPTGTWCGQCPNG